MLFDILLEKKSLVRLNEAKTKEKLKGFCEAATKNKSLGFRAKTGKLGEPELFYDEEERKEGYIYRVTLKLQITTRSPEVAENRFAVALLNIRRVANADGWKVPDDRILRMAEDGLEITRPAGGSGDLMPRPEFVLPELTPEVYDTVFAGVYEREAHIRICYHSVRAYLTSLQRHKLQPKLPVHRSHILLKGPPGAAKTLLFERFKEWFDGEEGGIERVKFLDGPTLTKAGLDSYILGMAERGESASILVIEELEKQNQDNLLSLLSVMASGRISRLNARIGHREAVSDLIIWATCNDPVAVANFRKGALWSRFTHKLHCPRPSRGLMHRILVERAESMGGSPEWAERAIEFAFDELPRHTGAPLDDPREIIGLLDGGDRLLDRSYQLDKLSVLLREIEDEKRQAEADLFLSQQGMSDI